MEMDQHTTDQQRWTFLKMGDKEALGQLFKRHYASLHQYGYKITGNSNIVEDCLQDLFLYIYEKRATLGEVEYVRAYLFRSFRRRLMRTLRNQRKSVYVSLDNSWIVAPKELEILDRDERRRKQLADMINELSPRQREMIYLRYYSGLSPQEIAEMLSVSYRAVINTLYKAMVKLRKDKERLRDISRW